MYTNKITKSTFLSNLNLHFIASVCSFFLPFWWFFPLFTRQHTNANRWNSKAFRDKLTSKRDNEIHSNWIWSNWNRTSLWNAESGVEHPDWILRIMTPYSREIRWIQRKYFNVIHSFMFWKGLLGKQTYLLFMCFKKKGYWKREKGSVGEKAQKTPFKYGFEVLITKCHWIWKAWTVIISSCW